MVSNLKFIRPQSKELRLRLRSYSHFLDATMIKELGLFKSVGGTLILLQMYSQLGVKALLQMN